jgi:hypothetical protein
MADDGKIQAARARLDARKRSTGSRSPFKGLDLDALMAMSDEEIVALAGPNATKQQIAGYKAAYTKALEAAIDAAG